MTTHTPLSAEERSKAWHEISPLVDGCSAAYALRADHEAACAEVERLTEQYVTNTAEQTLNALMLRVTAAEERARKAEAALSVAHDEAMHKAVTVRFLTADGAYNDYPISVFAARDAVEEGR